MTYVGVDLAWGERRPSGVAVLDSEGRLVHVTARTTDEELLDELRPHTSGPCVVAFDAPLVVVNETGNRPCEAELNRDFAPFDAGAHPSNTRKREFQGTPRGARLADALGLDIDPASTAPRRALEVYPHPATIALFRLGRTLKYKQRTGRTLTALTSELGRLVGLLEGLAAAQVPLHVTANAQWRALVEQVESASRKSDLRRVEDQVDAVLCAYIALFAARRPDLVTTYGDLATGYIVTPTLPEGHTPSPRPRAGLATPPADRGGPVGRGVRHAVRRAVEEYAELQPVLHEATSRYAGLVTSLLDDAGINYLSIDARTKGVASFAAKAAREQDGAPLFAEPLVDITDQLGVRVITYLQRDVDAVADLLGEQLVVLDDRDMGRETASEGRFGYASRHLLVRLDETRRAAPSYAAIGDRAVQVQVRTVLQHAWAEFEHAIRYKGRVPEEHGADLERRFTLAAGLLELADREFSLIQERLQGGGGPSPSEPDSTDPRIDAQDLAQLLATRHPDAGWSRPDHYEWVAGLLLELGITSLEELGALLDSVDSTAINDRMGYRQPPTAVRRLDDALLCLYGERYIGLHGNAHRVELLRTRLGKLDPDTQ
jgi:predicted RNase H-like nuclease/ppGpp synthetase/RelA/SpoT-type nucleotidyltranferase